MPNWREVLQGPALRVAEATERVLRVAAGPGTGKSFAMKCRLAKLIAEDGIDPRRILAVTFTRTAASDLVQDIRRLEVPGVESIAAGTLHSYCFGLLSREAVFTILRRTPRPLVSFQSSGVLRYEAEPLLADLRDQLFGGMQEKTRRLLAFEADWARLQSDEPGWPPDPIDSQFHAELIDWLQYHKAILIGELIPLALHYLRDNPEAEEHTAFDVVVVDEYQDLNRAEQVLIDTLAENEQLMVIGDEDQSIYSFRHANPEGINDFLRTHHGVLDQPLAECRRCPKQVVAMADNLIRNNHGDSLTERLTPKADNPDGNVGIVQWPTLDDEIRGLVAYTVALVSSNSAEPGDVLVLAPRRLIGYRIRDGLKDAGVPVHSFFSEEAVEASEAQLALTTLRLLVDRSDRVALRWWLGLGSPSWRSGEYGRIRAEAPEQDPIDILREVHEGARAVSKISGCLDRYRELISHLDALADMPVSALVDRLLPDGEAWARAMREAAILHLEVEAEPTMASLADAIVSAVTQPTMPEAGQFVRVMSLHKSKGLTAKVVIVAGCNQGLIPTIIENRYSRPVAEQIREGRRLFYVACTRCTETLVLSSFARVADSLAHKLGLAQGRRRGRQINVQASPFLRELGSTSPRAQRGQDWLESEIAQIRSI